MTEIHERLQPVAEVGENGEEDSLSGEQAILPLGIKKTLPGVILITCPYFTTLISLVYII